MNLFTYHLRGLADFSGRERRRAFWLWLLIVYVAQMAITMIVMIPLMANWFSTIETTVATDPERLNGHPEIMMQAMGPLMQQMMTVGAISALLGAVLLGAAAVRRLHDSGKPGWWAAPYFVFSILTPLLAAKFFPAMMPTMANPAAMQATGGSMQIFSLIQAVGLLLLLMMIVLLVAPTAEHDNAYGPPPPLEG